MDKFIIVWCDEAIKKKYPYADQYKGYCNLCYETDGEKPIRLVGSDNGEPEDKTLGRDFSWVIDELNILARNNDVLKEQVKALLNVVKAV